MPKVEIRPEAIVDYVSTKIIESGLLEGVEKLKVEFDFNPFNDDGDEFEGAWAEMRHNVDLLAQVCYSAIHLVETVVVDGVSLSNPQKRKVVIDVLDDCLRLPWYLEPFDGTAIGMFVDAGVAFLNATSWIREIPGVGEVDAKAAPEEKLVVDLASAGASLGSPKRARERRAAVAAGKFPQIP